LFEKFQHIIRQYPGYRSKTYLIAVSGGMDSMVLLDLMHRTGLKIHAAHCNFLLRGEESNKDMALVQEVCRDKNIPLHLHICPVKKNTNIQLEARRLRYDYFNRLLRSIPADYLLTAHHANDEVETFFINLLRGTGIQGLTGISETAVIKRPLLAFTKAEIEAYAEKHRIPWREDASNQSDYYVRNAIRHHLLPLLDKIRPSAEKNIIKTMHLLKLTAEVEDDWFRQWKNKTVEQRNGEEIFYYEKFDDKNKLPLFLHKWTYEKGFHDGEALMKLISAQTGRYVESPSHLIIKHGNSLILTPKISPLKSVKFDRLPSKISSPVSLEFTEIKKTPGLEQQVYAAPPHIIYIDADKFSPPYEIRPWQAGDRMRPLGLKGSKKISDILKDLKIPLHRKQQTCLLLSNNTPVWLIGYRLDDRFKITSGTKRVIKIIWKKNFSFDLPENK